MAKPDLIAELNELSGKLGRELSIEGTIPILEARIEEAHKELSMLNSDDDIDGDDVLGVIDTDTTISIDSSRSEEDIIGSINELNKEPKAEQSAHSKRRIRLRVTLDVYHYKKGFDKRQPNLTKRIRQIVAAGKEIVVDADEAAYLIAENHADAL